MIYEKLEHIFESFINYCVLAIEFVGVCVLLFAVAKGVISFIRHKKRLRLELAEGIALALEFKMGSELLRTVVVREMSELWTSWFVRICDLLCLCQSSTRIKA